MIRRNYIWFQFTVIRFYATRRTWIWFHHDGIGNILLATAPHHVVCAAGHLIIVRRSLLMPFSALRARGVHRSRIGAIGWGHLCMWHSKCTHGAHLVEFVRWWCWCHDYLSTWWIWFHGLWRCWSWRPSELMQVVELLWWFVEVASCLISVGLICSCLWRWCILVKEWC